jgi:hypothetical protein
MRSQQQDRKLVLGPLSFICFAIGVIPITRGGSTGSHSHGETDAEIPLSASLVGYVFLGIFGYSRAI